MESIMLSKKFFKTKAEAEITFEFTRSDAEFVELVADFNDWKPVVMKFNKKEKTFKTKVKLPKDGSYHFRYLINGSDWENDQSADQLTHNEFGSQNSVVMTVAQQ